MTDEVPGYTVGPVPGKPGLIPFKKGVYNPHRKNGSPAFSRRVLACLNALADTDADGKALHDLPALQAIAQDGKAEHAKGVAADILQHVRTVGWDKISRQPKMLSTLSWLFDRQLGKPLATLDVTHRVARSATEVMRDLIRVLPKILVTPEGQAMLTEAVRQQPDLADILHKIADQAPVEAPAMATDSAGWNNGNDVVVRDLQ